MIGTFAFLATFYLYRRRNIEKLKAIQAVVNSAETIAGSWTTEAEKVTTSGAETPSPPAPV